MKKIQANKREIKEMGGQRLPISKVKFNDLTERQYNKILELQEELKKKYDIKIGRDAGHWLNDGSFVYEWKFIKPLSQHQENQMKKEMKKLGSRILKKTKNVKG